MANWLDDLKDYGSTSWEEIRNGLPQDFGAPVTKRVLDIYSDPHLSRAARLGRTPAALLAAVPDAAYNVGAFINKAPDALATSYDYLFGDPTQAPSTPKQDLAKASKTAEKAIDPEQKQIEDAAARLMDRGSLPPAPPTGRMPADLSQNIPPIDEALLADAVAGAPQGNQTMQKELAALSPSMASPEQKPTENKDDQDMSKAMLRAGIAMMSSKGDIWDALAAGLGGYTMSLDEQEAKKAEKAKEEYERMKDEREFMLDKYKADIYGEQVRKSGSGSGGGGSNSDMLRLMGIQINQQKFAEDQLQNRLKELDKIDERLGTPGILPNERIALQADKLRLGNEITALRGGAPVSNKPIIIK